MDDTIPGCNCVTICTQHCELDKVTDLLTYKFGKVTDFLTHKFDTATNLISYKSVGWFCLNPFTGTTPSQRVRTNISTNIFCPFNLPI